MPEIRVHRSPWRDFPDVIVQTTVDKLRSRAAYDKAKRGVGEAAFKVIQELFKPEKIQFDFDTVVPVMQFDRAYPNALPIAYAIALAKHFEADLELEILQANVEVERDLISERTREGLASARAKGRLLGRPKGVLGKSRLDGKEEEIRLLLQKQVSKASIAKILGVTRPTIHRFIKTRRLRPHP